MMKKFRLLVVLGLGMLSGLSVFGAVTGSCEQSARNLVDKSEFQVQPEYDDASGTYIASNLVYYFKSTLKRSTEYTAYLEVQEPGGRWVVLDDESAALFDVYPADATGDTFPATASFYTSRVGNHDYFWLPEYEWTFDPTDPEFNDPASWPYYFEVKGTDPSRTYRIRFLTGIHIPEGIEDNPVKIDPPKRPDVLYVDKTETGDEEHDHILRGGMFYVGAQMKKSRKYLYNFKATPCAKEEVVSFEFVGDGRTNRYTKVDGLGSEWTGWTSYVPYSNDEENELTRGMVSAMTNGYVQVEVVVGNVTNLVWTNMMVYATASTADFHIAYCVLPDRTIAEHGPKPLKLGESVNFVPGHLANPAYIAYDDIIDDNLYEFSVAKGKRYALSTVGAQTNMLMRVYDKNGEIVYENTDSGDGFECRIVFTAEAAATYYVGVCQALRDDDVDEPLGLPIDLAFESAEPVDGEPDEWDAEDDTYVGASGLMVMPGTNGVIVVKEDPKTHKKIREFVGDDPVKVDAAGHGSHRLGKTDWTDMFMIGGRKGITYALRVSLPEGAGQVRNTLTAHVYTLNGKNLVEVSTIGNVNASSEQPLWFTATANTTYYIELSVAEGVGFEYPPYLLHAIGCDAETGRPLGGLLVDPKGAASATWKLNRESVKYPAGASILVPAGDYDVTYLAVTGFNTPEMNPRKVSVMANQITSVLDDFYTDKFDPKDDACSGKGVDAKGKSISYAATSWSVSNKETVQERTLWHSDPEDNFTFAGKDGQYYDFALTRRDLTNETCDAVFSITNAELGVICENETSVHQVLLPTTKAKYFLTVKHANPAEQYNNGSYSLSGYFANVGYLKFAKAAVSVKDNAATVKLTVNRTQKDGKVRATYETVDGTAVAGTNYVAQAGELVWEAGDNKAKTIEVRLIPKLRSFYAGGANLDFKVVLRTIPDSDRDWDEYPTQIQKADKSFAAEDAAVVTITESANKKLTDPMDNYKPVKGATVKTEVTALRAGTFDGILTAPVAGKDSPDAAVETDVVGKWNFNDETDPGHDSGMLQNHLSATNGAAAVKVVTDAERGQVAYFPSGASLEGTGEAGSISGLPAGVQAFTLAYWLKCEPGVTSPTAALVHWGTNEVIEAFSFYNRLDCAGGAEQMVAGNADGANPTDVPGITDGNWHHFAVTYDERSGYRTYTNGVLAAETEPLVTNNLVRENFSIGRPWSGASTAFAGYLDDVVLLNQSLTQEEILNRFVLPATTYLTNGFPAVASVKLTIAVKDKKNPMASEKDTLSAAVSLAGKKYTFKPQKNETAWDGEDSLGRKVKKLTLEQTINKVKYTNTLEIAVCDGMTTNVDDWAMASIATNAVTLTMMVPDASGKGVQSNVVYRGEVFRDNSKIQAYLDAVTNFVGYYTTALVIPQDDVMDGYPSGNGYMCLTIDNKGKAKLTGKLVDGSSVSLSSMAYLAPDETSANGYSAYIPFYSAKKPFCIGGTLRLFAEPTTDYDGVREFNVVKVDSDSPVAWFNDNAGLSYENLFGFAYDLYPVGGYFDTVINLQSYYINHALTVATTEVNAFPTELFTYPVVSTQEANGSPVNVNLNAFETAKKAMVKDAETKLYDFEWSVNPANVQVKLARATGLVSGSFSIWTEGVDAKSGKVVQKEVTGAKHYGVLLLSRDEKSKGGLEEPLLPEDIASAGFFNTSVKLKDPETNKTRTWIFSGPFDIR